jgi:hypothetical protein
MENGQREASWSAVASEARHRFPGVRPSSQSAVAAVHPPQYCYGERAKEDGRSAGALQNLAVQTGSVGVLFQHSSFILLPSGLGAILD